MRTVRPFRLMFGLGVLGVIAALLPATAEAAPGPPQFDQKMGIVDSPCGGGSDAVYHCTAHAFLVNHGGEGVGHATVLVQLKDAAGGSAALTKITCGRSIPDTPSGGFADLVCNFDLPAGKAVAAVPTIQSIDYAAAASGSASSSETSGLLAIVTLVVAGASSLLSLAALVVALRLSRQRQPVNVPVGSPAGESRPAAAAPRGEQWNSEPRTADVDAAYKLPRLP